MASNTPSTPEDHNGLSPSLEEQLKPFKDQLHQQPSKQDLEAPSDPSPDTKEDNDTEAMNRATQAVLEAVQGTWATPNKTRAPKKTTPNSNTTAEIRRRRKALEQQRLDHETKLNSAASHLAKTALRIQEDLRALPQDDTLGAPSRESINEYLNTILKEKQEQFQKRHQKKFIAFETELQELEADLQLVKAEHDAAGIAAIEAAIQQVQEQRKQHQAKSPTWTSMKLIGPLKYYRNTIGQATPSEVLEEFSLRLAQTLLLAKYGPLLQKHQTRLTDLQRSEVRTLHEQARQSAADAQEAAFIEAEQMNYDEYYAKVFGGDIASPTPTSTPTPPPAASADAITTPLLPGAVSYATMPFSLLETSPVESPLPPEQAVAAPQSLEQRDDTALYEQLGALDTFHQSALGGIAQHMETINNFLPRLLNLPKHHSPWFESKRAKKRRLANQKHVLDTSNHRLETLLQELLDLTLTQLREARPLLRQLQERDPETFPSDDAKHAYMRVRDQFLGTLTHLTTLAQALKPLTHHQTAPATLPPHHPLGALYQRLNSTATTARSSINEALRQCHSEYQQLG